MRSNDMTLQELRLLSVYLSKINPFDKSTALVRFPIKDFHAIMEVEMQWLRLSYYEQLAERPLHKIIKIPLKYGFEAFTLFRRVRYEYDEADGQYYFELEASEDALPLLFDLRDNFFKYELWNALRLRGKNHLRMYEILKQYEWRGYCVLAVREIKALLGLSDYEYPAYKGFRQQVLEPCRIALAENTDISYTYAPHSKEGKKIIELKFTIVKNPHYRDPILLRDFIDRQDILLENNEGTKQYWDQDEDEIDPDTLTRYQERLLFFRDAVDAEFSERQMIVLCDVLAEKAKHVFYDDKACFDYLRRKFNEAKLRESRGEIRHTLFSYLRSIIGTA